MTARISLLALAAALSSSATTCNAFTTRIAAPKHSTTKTPPLKALIFGWDGGDDEGGTSTTAATYFDTSSDDMFGQSCSPVGTAVAEALSFDSQRAGHLARLAVAFSPPERALDLSRIQRVDVLCVHEDSIDIEAIICEDGSCVSLNVPIKFPRDCQSVDHSALEGCVMKNLDELDAEAGSLLKVQEENTITQDQSHAQFDENCVLNEHILNFPNWWIPPECDYNLADECQSVKVLLNDPEFQADINALSQDTLRKMKDGEDYKVLQAKVAIVGPAGICFKVRAEFEMSHDRRVHILDVAYPFGETMTSVSDMRAAVLGAVSAADGI